MCSHTTLKASVVSWLENWSRKGRGTAPGIRMATSRGRTEPWTRLQKSALFKLRLSYSLMSELAIQAGLPTHVRPLLSAARRVFPNVQQPALTQAWLWDRATVQEAPLR